MNLPIIYYPDPRLRKRCPEITGIDEQLIAFIKDFEQAMLAHDAIGFGANQVGSEYRVCLSRCIGGTKDEGPQIGKTEVFINPKLSNPSKEKWSALEANPCIPGVQGEVERPVSITVEWQNIDGSFSKKELSWWPARVLMHENDHINGVLFIDRLPKKKK